MHNHTEHTNFADVETSSAQYASRFAGEVGNWFLKKQTAALTDCLSEINATTILDVGGGHGQTAHGLHSLGYDITILGSTPECSGQITTLVNEGKCKFEVGNIEKLAYADNSFDVVTCLRYLSHTDNWQAVISELCRVARKAVIIDFPPIRSFNIMFPFLYKLKRKLEGNTRPYLVFKNSEIHEEFEKNDFRLACHEPQFFFPMVLHRVFKNAKVSQALECIPNITGMTYLFGSPVIECFIKNIIEL